MGQEITQFNSKMHDLMTYVDKSNKVHSFYISEVARKIQHVLVNTRFNVNFLMPKLQFIVLRGNLFIMEKSK